MTLMTLMPSRVANISKIVIISRQHKLKDLLCEQQDFFYCLLINLIFLKPRHALSHPDA